MSDIIAGSPAPTNPAPRERLVAKVTFVSDQHEADFMADLDAYRAEVLAAIADLQEATAAADVIRRRRSIATGRRIVAAELRRMAAEAGESRG